MVVWSRLGLWGLTGGLVLGSVACGDEVGAEQELGGGDQMYTLAPGETGEYREDADIEDMGFPTDDCEGFVLDEEPWILQPGENVDYCVRIPIPEKYRDRDLVLKGWGWNLGPTHHYFMEHSPNPHPDPEAGAVPCNEDGTQRTFTLLNAANDEGSTLAFGAGEGSGYTVMDADHGKFLAGGGHFRTSHHVVNFTTEPMEISAKFKVCIGDAEKTRFPGNTLVCTTTAINIPDAVEGSASATCTAPFDMDVFTLASHAHQHLTRFTIQAYRDGETQPEILYESEDWDSPQIVNLDEPIHLKKGEGLTYTCNYQGPVFFMDSAEDPQAEHCAVFTAYSYPEGQEYEVPPRLTGIGYVEGQVSPAFLSVEGSPI